MHCRGIVRMSKSSTANGVPDELQRRLGVGDAVVIGLGSMIGAGVFAALAPAARAAGAGLLFGLSVAAVVAYCNATSSARLAARYPSSGGTYVYGRERLGDFWGYRAGGDGDDGVVHQLHHGDGHDVGGERDLYRRRQVQAGPADREQCEGAAEEEHERDRQEHGGHVAAQQGSADDHARIRPVRQGSVAFAAVPRDAPASRLVRLGRVRRRC